MTATCSSRRERHWRNRLRCAVFACAATLQAACATVTQEEPPSKLGPGAGTGGTAGTSGSSGAGGQGGSGAAVGGSGPGGGAGLGNALGGRGGSVSASAGSGGSVSMGGGDAADAGRQFPPGTVLLEESFEDFQSEDWDTTEDSLFTVVPDPRGEGSVYAQTETQSSSRHLALTGEGTWTDVIIQADINVVAFNGSASGYMAGICFRASDEDNFYMAGLRGSGDEGFPIQVRSFGDEDTNLDQSDFLAAENTWYTLRVEAIGSSIRVSVDGDLVLTVDDDEHAQGAVGLCTVRASAMFDNLIVTAP